MAGMAAPREVSKLNPGCNMLAGVMDWSAHTWYWMQQNPAASLTQWEYLQEKLGHSEVITYKSALLIIKVVFIGIVVIERLDPSCKGRLIL